MSIPDFGRAEYVETPGAEGRTIEGNVTYGGAPAGALARALVFGAVAAVVGACGYALVGLSGFMVSIVAIGVGWLIAKAMMTGSGGVGGRSYQVGAVALTYLAVSCGDLLSPLWKIHSQRVPWSRMLGSPMLLKYLLLGPFLGLHGGGAFGSLNGVIGLLILFFGLRTAWRVAAGSPGFGQSGNGPGRMTPFGFR